jgi:hypothetical protein
MTGTMNCDRGEVDYSNSIKCLTCGWSEAAAQDAPAPASGRHLYRAACAACHGADGRARRKRCSASTRPSRTSATAASRAWSPLRFGLLRGRETTTKAGITLLSPRTASGAGRWHRQTPAVRRQFRLSSARVADIPAQARCTPRPRTAHPPAGHYRNRRTCQRSTRDLRPRCRGRVRASRDSA